MSSANIEVEFVTLKKSDGSGITILRGQEIEIRTGSNYYTCIVIGFPMNNLFEYNLYVKNLTKKDGTVVKQSAYLVKKTYSNDLQYVFPSTGVVPLVKIDYDNIFVNATGTNNEWEVENLSGHKNHIAGPEASVPGSANRRSSALSAAMAATDAALNSSSVRGVPSHGVLASAPVPTDPAADAATGAAAAAGNGRGSRPITRVSTGAPGAVRAAALLKHITSRRKGASDAASSHASSPAPLGTGAGDPAATAGAAGDGSKGTPRATTAPAPAPPAVGATAGSVGPRNPRPKTVRTGSASGAAASPRSENSGVVKGTPLSNLFKKP